MQLHSEPGRYGRIGYAIGPAAPLLDGLVLVAATPQGLCAVLLGDAAELLVADLKRRFEAAEIVADPAVAPCIDAVLRALQVPATGGQPRAAMAGSAAPIRSGPAGVVAGNSAPVEPGSDLPLDLRATAFEAQVWAALAAIPRGETRSYAQLAAKIGRPGAARAVAGACARNPVAVLVPCHRVLGSNGRLTGYRWGLERKQALLALEQTALPQR